MMIGCPGRISHQNKIICNANNGSDSRVHFQSARTTSNGLKKSPETGILWNNGAGLNNTRTNRSSTTQVSLLHILMASSPDKGDPAPTCANLAPCVQVPEPAQTIPELILEE